jgi:serine/threonine-protein kinase
MAPELAAAAKDVDGRADVYALGCLRFEILACEPLHRSDQRTGDHRPSVRAPGRDIPPELDALCVRATHIDRTKRIQTPRELGEAVERFLDGDRDLALRRDLARTHLDTARAAFEAGDGGSARRIAMREAGRALALDPKLAGAGELVTRLMLEPPKVRPPDMDKLIQADDLETLHRMARAGALGYVGFLSFLPLIAAGPEMLGYLGALVLVLALNVWLLLYEGFFSNIKARAVKIVLGNALLVALLARMSSPFVIAPSVAALATMALISSPTYSRPRAAVVLALTMSVAVLVPWILEATGVLSPTNTFFADGLVMSPPILGVGDVGKYAVLGGFIIAIIGAAASMAYQNRKAERIVRDRIHLQAWQLRQLVS